MSYDPNQPYEQVPYSDPYQPSPPRQPPQPPQVPPAYPAYAQPSYYTQPPPQPPQAPPQPYMPPMPMYMPPPPQPKKSRRWLWITLGIIGGVVLLSCAGCVILFGPVVERAFGPAFITGEYYQYVKAQDYNRAYAFLDSNATITVNGQNVSNDLQSFTAAAQNADTQLGPITNFSVTTTDSNDLSHLTAVVTRQNGQAYDVHLTFSQVGGTTKIASMDGI